MTGLKVAILWNNTQLIAIHALLVEQEYANSEFLQVHFKLSFTSVMKNSATLLPRLSLAVAKELLPIKIRAMVVHNKVCCKCILVALLLHFF